MQSQTLKRSISRSPSAWYSPPFPHHHNPILTTLSHAISNSPTKPLHVSLSKLLPSLTPSHVVDLIVLNPYSLSPHSLFSFFNFLSSHPTFRHTLHSYSAMSHFLVAHNMLPQARFLLNFLVSRKGKDSASSIFASVLETKDCLIDGMCKNGRTDLAMGTYQQFLTKGFKPDLIMYNSLINGLCKAGDLKGAKKLIAEMSLRGLKPDKFTYTILLDGFCKEGDMESALGIREEMIKQGIKLDDVAFTALISGLCKEERHLDAERALREMLDAGMKPDAAAYTMVMDGFCKKGDVRMGFKLLKLMQSDGHVPGVVTYNVLMNGLCKQGQLRNANKLLDNMLNLGVVPDTVTYNILLDGHCKKANPKDFGKLKSEMGLVADYASYSSLISKISGTSKHHSRR